MLNSTMRNFTLAGALVVALGQSAHALKLPTIPPLHWFEAHRQHYRGWHHARRWWGFRHVRVRDRRRHMQEPDDTGTTDQPIPAQGAVMQDPPAPAPVQNSQAPSAPANSAPVKSSAAKNSATKEAVADSATESLPVQNSDAPKAPVKSSAAKSATKNSAAKEVVATDSATESLPAKNSSTQDLPAQEVSAKAAKQPVPVEQDVTRGEAEEQGGPGKGSKGKIFTDRIHPDRPVHFQHASDRTADRVADRTVDEPADPDAADTRKPIPRAKEPRGSAEHLSVNALIAKHSAANGVPESLVRRVIMRESRYNPHAVHAGNYGLMQIRLGTARAMGYRGPPEGLLDADTNMTYAVRYLAGAYHAAGGNESRAVALYASGYYTRRYRSSRASNDVWSLFGGAPGTSAAPVRRRRGAI